MITIWKTPIVTTVEQVVRDLKLELYATGLLRDVNNTGSDLMCTCPFHGNGRENNPSLGLLLHEKVVGSKKREAGTAHCFTCGYTADLPQFVADVLELSNSLDGFKWLVGKYNYASKERAEIDLNLYRGDIEKASYMADEEVKRYHNSLINSKEACEYLHKRKIANWVIESYDLGFDPEDNTVLFPVKDLDGGVLFYKGRSITGKHFYNAKDVDKSSIVFGLFELVKGNFTFLWGKADGIKEVWITESEIDALSLISLGYPAVAIMGSHISEEQCRELEKSPFRHFVLATDNDEAGRKGASQIKRILIPKGFRFTNLNWETDLKDVNDLIKTYGDSWIDYLTGY